MLGPFVSVDDGSRSEHWLKKIELAKIWSKIVRNIYCVFCVFVCIRVLQGGKFCRGFPLCPEILRPSNLSFEFLPYVSWDIEGAPPRTPKRISFFFSRNSCCLCCFVEVLCKRYCSVSYKRFYQCFA